VPKFLLSALVIAVVAVGCSASTEQVITDTTLTTTTTVVTKVAPPTTTITTLAPTTTTTVAPLPPAPIPQAPAPEPVWEEPVVATPEPVVAPATDLESLICATFVNDCGKALSVVYCESRFNPGTVGAAGERGLFQIHPVHIPYLADRGMTWDSMFDPASNIAYAYDLYSRSGWGPWTCA
jgi:hypothetical protein